MFVSCECCVLYKYRPLRWTNPSSRGDLQSVYVPLRVIGHYNNPLYVPRVGKRSQTKMKYNNTKAT
jgi:hypothetical protein